MQGQEARLILFSGDQLEYRFCNHQWKGSRRAVPIEQLQEQLRALQSSRCHRLILDGGAPTEHPDFSAIVRKCKDAHPESLALQTEGRVLGKPGAVSALIEQGFDTLFLFVGGIRKRVHETTMADPNGFQESLDGLQQAVSRSELRTYIVVPVLRWTKDDLIPFLEWTQHLPQKPTGFLLSLPEIRAVTPAMRKVLLPYQDLAKLAEAVFQTCSRARIEYGFATRRGVPPCASGGALEKFGTVFHERFNYLKRVQDEEFVRVPACENCSVQHSCRGMEAAYVEHFGSANLEPVPLDHSLNWKLRRLNKLERRDFKNVSDFETELESSARSLVRINGHCNMACSFCFVDRTVSDFDFEPLVREIDQLASKQRNHLVLSGGEPTLHPRLPDLLRHAQSLGFKIIEMQSNGVRAADMGYARELVDAGLNKVTISLHSTDPEHSDEITKLPKSFAKTVRAMHNFRELGVVTQVAHVITMANYKELPKTVRFLREEFPVEGGHLSVCFGIAQGISDLVFQWVIPKFDDIKPFMKEALDYCLETEVGFGGMLGQGGYPPCMLDGDLRYYERNLGHIYRSRDHDQQFFKSSRCQTCSFDPYCVGVRRSYIEAYGEQEVRPFEAAIHPPTVVELPPAQTSSPEETLVPLRLRKPL